MNVLKALISNLNRSPVLILASLFLMSSLSYASIEALGPEGISIDDWSEIQDTINGAGSEDHAALGFPAIQRSYIKASNTDPPDGFGWSVAMSGDTIVVGAPLESSSANGVEGDQSSNDAYAAGAVYVFVRSLNGLSQQAYLKASNSEDSDAFGEKVAISGNTIVVTATGEDSDANGIDGDQGSNDAGQSGAAYVFHRDGSTWTQQAYLKASNSDWGDSFGQSVAISGDTIVIGADGEDSGATGVNGDQGNLGLLFEAGAAYVFVRAGTSWSQQAYLKPPDMIGVGPGSFGWSVAISGNTIVVGEPGRERANVFIRESGQWSQEAQLGASNSASFDRFGFSVAIHGDTIAVGAINEDSDSDIVDGDQGDVFSHFEAGAAYVFTRNGSDWSQEAYLKAFNSDGGDNFGWSVDVTDEQVVVGSMYESSDSDVIDGDQTNNDVFGAGAAYVFTRNNDIWSQTSYLKASNSDAADWFGRSVSINGDLIMVGAPREDSNSVGIGGDQNNNDAERSGAAYLFSLENSRGLQTQAVHAVSFWGLLLLVGSVFILAMWQWRFRA